MRPGRVEQPICAAPSTSMYLDPHGDVRACCQNRWYPLGNVANDRLVDIWRGSSARTLRSHVLAHDLRLGCELCAVTMRDGAAEAAYLHQFDDLRGGNPSDPPWPLQLELALSISCNLQCVMCNGELSSSIRAHREHRPVLASPYGDRFFGELDEFLTHVRRVMFLGGEPFLGREPLRVMERLVERGLTPHCAVTTNGTQWNDRVRRVLAALPLDVLVSIDGFSDEVISSIRVGTDRATLHANVERYLATTRAAGNRLHLTFCLMEPNWHEFGRVLEWADALEVDVQVNDVTHPAELSLLHAPLERLTEVVDTLGREDRARSTGLGRNLHVWQRELGRLSAILNRRRNEQGRAGEPHTDARGLAAHRGAGATVHEVVVDRSNVITSIGPSPADVFGVDVRSCVGDTAASLMETVFAALGPLVHSDLDFHSGGVEEREFVLTDAQGRRRHLVATMSRTAPGETWYLTEVTDDATHRGDPPSTPVVLRHAPG